MISPWLQACIYLKMSLLFGVFLLFRGNILSSPFCQRRCVYFKTLIAAIHYIKWAGFTSRTTAQKRKFSIRDFFSKCDQIRNADLVIFTEETLNEKLHFVQWTFQGYFVYLKKAIAAPTFLRYLFFFADLKAVIFSWRVLCHSAILLW